MSALETMSTITCGCGGRSATTSRRPAGCCTASPPSSTPPASTHVTTAVAVQWALAARVTAPSSVPATRYSAVRGFARYMAGIDPRTEIPPAGLVRRPRSRRSAVHLHRRGAAGVARAGATAIPQPLRAATMQTLIGLLASSGLRVGEALRLDRGDIDWSDGVLHIRQSKFNKSRWCRWRPASLRRWSATHTYVIACARPRQARASSSRSAVPA